ncbi:TetR family transcriptional regulator [Kribbella antiqua]|uniref:TetR family transcriptional regulator n=1 Tax=Kribbella antiqua TaxID=2512217 RepID=A0A4R2IV92_9ACTN|nr:TetR/AcrR family transcriptional regulator [Kribbella antiqua]TCO49294.1 TetR family transcriptional regulator [Kribbella antiqua]
MGTRDDLIEVATGLLDAGGVAAVTLREVGRLAGVSHNAPYKHFADKQALLAAVAARDLARHTELIQQAVRRKRSAKSALSEAMGRYIAWALEYPERFRLVFGRWTAESPELTASAEAAQAGLIGLVEAAQAAGALPAGDPVRLASLVRSVAHGAADLAATGHLSETGKGHASPQQLVDDLLAYLQSAS